MLRSFTLGRAFALLLVGMGIGAVIYIARHLSTGTVKAQIVAALQEFVPEEKLYLGDVILDPRKGVELHDLRIFYDKESNDIAIEVSRALLYVNHQQLLRGDVEIKQIDLYGVVVHLRREGGKGAPTIPGVFLKRPGTAFDISEFPTIRVEPDATHVGSSRVEIRGLPLIGDARALALSIVSARGEPDGPHYSINAHISGDPPVESDEPLVEASVHLSFKPSGIVDGRLDLKRFAWSEDTPGWFEPKSKKAFRALRFSGVAMGKATLRVDLANPKDATFQGTAVVSGVCGQFGNLYTGDPAGFPFKLMGARGEVRFDQDGIEIDKVRGTYVSPSGKRGRLGADSVRVFGDEIVAKIWGKDIHATVDDLRLLLPSTGTGNVVEIVVDKYLPSGTFDFDVSIMGRPGAEKVRATLDMRDGSFEYAGKLDRYTNKRYGFRYPLQRCRARIIAETNVPTEHGPTDIIRLENIEGFHPISSATPDGPRDVRVVAAGTIVAYTAFPGEPEDVDVKIVVSDLPIDADLAQAFTATPSGQAPYHAFDLTGWAQTVRLDITADAFERPNPTVSYTINLRDCTLAYRRFPVHIDRISGTITSEVRPFLENGPDRRVIMIKNVKGQARDGGDVTGEGVVVQSYDRTEHIDITVESPEAVLGEDLRAAFGHVKMLGRPATELWDELGPKGRAKATIWVKTGLEVSADIELQGKAGISGVEGVPIPIERLVGLIEYRPKRLSLLNMTGYIGKSTVSINGDILQGGRVKIEATMHRLALDERFRATADRVLPALRSVLNEQGIQPESVFDASLSLWRAPGEKELNVTFLAKNIDIHALRRGLSLHVRGDRVEFENGVLTFHDLRLKSDDTRVHLRSGYLSTRPGGGGKLTLDATDLKAKEHLTEFLGDGLPRVLGENIRVDLEEFEIELNRPDGRIVLAGGASLHRYAVEKTKPKILAPTGSFTLNPITVTPPAHENDPVRFSGLVLFRGVNMNIALDLRDLHGELLIGAGQTTEGGIAVRGAVRNGRGTLFRRQFEKVALNLDYDPAFVVLTGIEGAIYAGTVRGKVEVHLKEPAAWDIYLRASNVDLAEFLEQDVPSKRFKGKVDAAIELRSPSGKIRHMAGQGQIRVKDGELMAVPGLRQMLATLARLAGGRRPKFKNADIDYTVKGETIHVKRF
ncbi:MAG: hypothetical protein O7E54_04945, partial [Planctomycetota bacterium]|nr:hypothetical protein [Planctomycetota bacterium]